MYMLRPVQYFLYYRLHCVQYIVTVSFLSKTITDNEMVRIQQMSNSTLLAPVLRVRVHCKYVGGITAIRCQRGSVYE